MEAARARAGRCKSVTEPYTLTLALALAITITITITITVTITLGAEQARPDSEWRRGGHQKHR